MEHLFPGNDGAIVRDFTHGSDHILFSGEDPGKLLHEAGSDIWTVEATDSSGNTYHDSIELVGITTLSNSEYSFG